MKVWPSAHPTVLQRTVGPEQLKPLNCCCFGNFWKQSCRDSATLPLLLSSTRGTFGGFALMGVTTAMVLTKLRVEVCFSVLSLREVCASIEAMMVGLDCDMV